MLTIEIKYPGPRRDILFKAASNGRWNGWCMAAAALLAKKSATIGFKLLLIFIPPVGYGSRKAEEIEERKALAGNRWSDIFLPVTREGGISAEKQE